MSHDLDDCVRSSFPILFIMLLPLILSRRLHCRAIVAPLESDEEMQLRIRPDLSNIMASGINLAALEDQR